MVAGQETCHDTHIADPIALVEVLNSNYFYANHYVPIRNWAILGAVLLIAGFVTMRLILNRR